MANVALKIKSDFEQAEKDFQDLKNISESTRKKIEKFSKSFKTEQIDKFRERNKLAGIAVTATSGKIAGMQREYSGLQKEIQGLIRRGMSPQDAALQKLITDYNKLDKELKQTRGTVNKTTVSFGSLVKGILGADIARTMLYKIKDGLGAIFTEARNLEAAKASFVPLMGGAKRAEELVKQLNITAAETPFQFRGIQKSVSTLLPVMNGDIEKTIETFKMLGDTAGGNQQKLESVTRGFTKAMLKGKVDMESLNMIAEAGVPIFNQMAESMGFGKDNMSAFFKEISTGKVSTDEMVEAFQKMTSEGGIFFEGMIIASRTTSGVISTMKDNIALTAAAIGQAFLPYIKEAAIAITGITKEIVKWINTGDNLKNTLSAIGYILAGLGSAFIAYQVATKIATVSSFGFVGAIKAMTVAIAANPIGLIATVITAVLVPAIIWMIKNWDKVKFYVVDFVLAARKKMLELNLAIREKVIGAITALLDKLGEIPLIGKAFKIIAENERAVTEEIRNNIAIVEQARNANRARFEESQRQAAQEVETTQQKATAIQEANNSIVESEQQKFEAFKEILENMSMSEQAWHEQKIEATSEFFQRRAKLEGKDHESRIKYLNRQFKKINKLYANNDKDRLAAERGLRLAIENEQRLLVKTRVEFGQYMLSQVGSLLADLQTVFRNAGRRNRALAVAMKGVAAAQALVNSFLAFTKALAAFPPPFNYAAAAVTLAAGLAKQAAILTTPIPSAQTGLMDYTVPDTRANRNDRAAVMASPGEQVTVAPRGEETEQTREVNIFIGEDALFQIVQRGIDTGEINVSDRNLGEPVFA